MTIAVSRDGGVLEIALDRPGKKNAITAAMYAALAEALREADSDDAIHAVLFRGNGDAFCAGNDLEDFAANPPADGDAPVFLFLDAASRAVKPFVAAVHGSAVGIGTTLLLHCELVYAAEDARFALPFTRLGLVPEFGSSYLLASIAGYQRAAELLLLGESFDANKAYEAGFVSAAAEIRATDQGAHARSAPGGIAIADESGIRMVPSDARRTARACRARGLPRPAQVIRRREAPTRAGARPRRPPRRRTGCPRWP